MDTDERYGRGLITEVYDQKQLQILDEEDGRGNNNDFVAWAWGHRVMCKS